MTQALYDSILLDLTEPLLFSEIARHHCVTSSVIQSVFETVRFGLPETICIDEFKGNSGIWSSKAHKWRLSKYHCSISDGDSHTVINILGQITGSVVNQYFRQFPPEERQRVKFFCCDMNNGFIIQASSPLSVQSEELTEWIRKYTSSRVEEIRSAACTIRHWRNYIQNSWKYGKSNGLSEGLNNKIKVLKRVSFGLHSFDAFRRRILLTCGRLRLSQNPFSVL